MPEQTQPQQPKRKNVGRSPGFPSIDLETALTKTKAMYAVEKRHFAHFSTVMQHWGYGAKSGQGRLAFSAVKKFGLIDVKGEGATKSARVSDFAEKILIDDRPGSTERAKALQEAALRPAIHAELWREFGGTMPSDTEMLFRLRSEKKFTEAGAKDFLAEFKRTLAYAKVDPSTKIGAASSEEDDDENGNGDEETMDDRTALATPPRNQTRAGTTGDQGNSTNKTGASGFTPAGAPHETPAQRKDVPLPLISGGTAVLQLPYLLSDEDFDWLKLMLDKLRRGMMAPPLPAPPFKIGDLVQWTSQGVDQFTEPRRVQRIEAGFVFVEGSPGGVPIAQVIRVG